MVADFALVGACGAPWSGLTVLAPPAGRPLYEAISRLPNDAMVAGFPGFAVESVPSLARRSAFVTRETHMPFHSHFTELTRRAHARRTRRSSTFSSARVLSEGSIVEPL